MNRPEHPLYFLAGCGGCDVYSDTDTHVGNWFGFVALEDAVINELIEEETERTDFAGVTINSGITIPAGKYGNFTSIDLTSGTILMLRT